MAIERWWRAIAAQSFISDGTTGGDIQIDDLCKFKVKQRVVISAIGEPEKVLEIKRICSPTLIKVGPVGGNIKAVTDITAYTVAKLASIRAEEQGRPPIDSKDTMRATYEEEPTVAWRNILVDCLGDFYDKDNRFPVDAEVSVGEINIDLPNAEGFTVLDVLTKDTEESFTFPDKLQYYRVKVRNHEDVLKIGLSAGDIASGDYKTVDRGNSFEPDHPNDFPDGYTLYFETKTKNNMKLEIEYWYFS